MYSVSSEYRASMKKPAQRVAIRGTVGTFAFNQDNICAGTFNITNQCVDNDELLLGAAYIGELQATFRNIRINKYEWIGKEIKPYHVRIFDDGTREEVPLGVYTISEATWSAEGVSVVAYDNMAKLDKTARFDATTGSAYGILTAICTACGLTLGMTEAEVQSLPNGSESFGLWADNNIETYRDMISYLAAALGSIVTVNRRGEIILKSYGMDVVDEVGATNRFLDASYSDFESRYSGISVVKIKDKVTKYFGLEEDIYLTYNLGENPFMQYGTDSTTERMCRAILSRLSRAVYVPFQATMLGDPAYDLGDVLTLTGGNADETKAFCIQRYTYGITEGYSVEGVGKNPDSANAKSKVDKQIAGLMSNTEQNTIQYYFYTNADEIEIADKKQRQIIDVRFASLTATVVIFEAEILLDVSTTESGNTYNDAVGIVTYYIDGAEQTEYKPTETWIDGKHILHLLYHINIGEGQMNRFVAMLTMNGGSAYIAPQGIQASIHGQGLAAIGEWNGYLDFDEMISEIPIGSIEVERNILENVTLWTDIPHSPTGSDTVGEITLGGITVEGFSELLLVDKDAMRNHPHSYFTPYTHEDIRNGFIHG